MSQTGAWLRPEALARCPAERLVAAAQAGDRRAFGELARRCRPRIFALALHVTGSRCDADDVVQDALLRAYRRIDDFGGRCQFSTWIYRIALNRALNLRRDRGRQASVPFDDDRIAAAVAVDAGGDPHRALCLSEDYALLLAALDGLSSDLRATVILVALQGLSHAEAAAVLQTREGTIGWRMHEARKRLAAHVASRGATSAADDTHAAPGNAQRDATRVTRPPSGARSALSLRALALDDAAGDTRARGVAGMHGAAGYLRSDIDT